MKKRLVLWAVLLIVIAIISGCSMQEGATTTKTTTPTAVAAGYYHTVAVKSDGIVWTWGYNNCGQLGNNSTTDSHYPVEISGF